MKHTLTREIDGTEVDVTLEIDYTYHPAHKGARDSLCGKRNAGPPLEPDEPAHFEINFAKDEKGEEVDLTDKEVAEIEETIAERYFDNGNEDDWREDR